MKQKTWSGLYGDAVLCKKGVERLAADIQFKIHDKDIDPFLKVAVENLNLVCIKLNSCKIREKTIGR